MINATYAYNKSKRVGNSFIDDILDKIELSILQASNKPEPTYNISFQLTKEECIFQEVFVKTLEMYGFRAGFYEDKENKCGQIDISWSK